MNVMDMLMRDPNFLQQLQTLFAGGQSPGQAFAPQGEAARPMTPPGTPAIMPPSPGGGGMPAGPPGMPPAAGGGGAPAAPQAMANANTNAAFLGGSPTGGPPAVPGPPQNMPLPGGGAPLGQLDALFAGPQGRGARQ